jgi:tripartite-type tricarboxylate transporter receptor subunit TctC
MNVQRLSAWIVSFAMFLWMSEAFAQKYPDRPIRIVLPFAAGGGVDSVARPLAQKLYVAFGYPVIIDNRPGAGGNIGIGMVAKSPADGYTLLVMSSNFAINPSLYPNPGYDPYKDFVPVTSLSSYMLFLVCNPSVPLRSVKALIAMAKEQPGKLTYASGGIATAGHFAAEMFIYATGARMTHVPYKGTGPAIIDTLGGQVTIMFGVPEVVPHIKSGRLAVLGVTGAKRSTALPNVPTIAESGVSGFEATSWHAMFAPTGTPEAIVNRLNDEVRKALRQPDVTEVLKNQGLDLVTGTPQQLTALVKATATSAAKVIKETGMSVN